MNIQQEIKLNIIRQAGQVALEFLRANPRPDEVEAGKDYNKVFKAVYNGMTDTITG